MGPMMSRKMTEIDTRGRPAPHESRVVLRDGRVLDEQRWVRTRQTVTVVLVVLGTLVALGLAFWGAAAVRGISL